MTWRAMSGGPYVVVHWWDDSVGGVGECLKALHATGKVGRLSLGTESMLQLRTAHVAGVTPASVVVPALSALTPACAALVADAALIKVDVVASNVLLGQARFPTVCSECNRTHSLPPPQGPVSDCLLIVHPYAFISSSSSSACLSSAQGRSAGISYHPRQYGIFWSCHLTNTMPLLYLQNISSFDSGPCC